jgi:hypothetical protein
MDGLTNQNFPAIIQINLTFEKVEYVKISFSYQEQAEGRAQ